MPDVKEQLLKGYKSGDNSFKVYLDAYDMTDLLSGKGPGQRKDPVKSCFVAHTFCPPPETRPDLSPETAVLELPLWTGYQSALAVP